MGYKSKLKAELESLQLTDIYSLMLFALYKIKDIPEYSTLSELVYILNKESLFNLLSCFGGTTIKIPTVEDLKILVNTLLVYQYVVFENYDLNDAIKLLKLDDEIVSKQIKDTYIKLSTIMANYNFKRS